jgi:hypothetical protein
LSADFVAARAKLVDALRAELVGPAAEGRKLDCSELPVKFETFEAASGPFVEASSGEEILSNDRPVKRYGVGVLYPIGLMAEAEPEATESEDVALEQVADEPAGKGEGVVDLQGSKRLTDGVDDDDLPLSTANSLRPSSMGLSFVLRCPPGSSLDVRLTGGHYKPLEVTVEGRKLTWWVRSPLVADATWTGDQLMAARGRIPASSADRELPEGIGAEIALVSRPLDGERSLVTVSAVNRSQPGRIFDSSCIFQAELNCRISGHDEAWFSPYEERDSRDGDPELRSLALLFRDVPAFAVGHGSAADWDAVSSHRATRVRTASLPVVEVPSTTPDIPGPDGKPIEVPMAPLAEPAGNDNLEPLEAIAAGYGGWINEQHERVGELDPAHRPVAAEHLQECEETRDRIRDGIAFLREDELAREAFMLANKAMLMQQERSGHPIREAVFDRSELKIKVAGEPAVSSDARGSWRPFQIAFILASLRSTAQGDDSRREAVELIFFPTGGGKTEAYLGLTAFSIFYRRLKDPADTGVDVLMRYTLRLLTAQQFQRASALICAMEHLRRQETARLGPSEISIGVWLGGSVTPNTRSAALASLRQLKKEGEGENKFVLLRCPWCAAQMGPIGATGKKAGRRGPEPKVAGYEVREESVVLRCPDRACDFHQGLPIYVIDEDVYVYRPSLVIGTVDKFAMLALRPEARALFGIGADGNRVASPPNLIVQDELHLISGPLGSMVGLYEALIEELCTDRRGDSPVMPKIIGSTATIRRFEQQVEDLYCREQVSLFPPRGLDAGNSYFGRYARDGDGALLPGRMYVGVHGSGLGSIQTAQVRTISTLLQAAALLDENVRDPWWTSLVFFNSLRELGTSLSLLQSDIPDYLRVLRRRQGFPIEKARRPWNVLELTGRLRNDEVPRAIEELERSLASPGRQPVDVCLASNIVEVGIDIDRLSLMTVVGQPKTTAQYIQATGRIGRSWWERPGLVTTLFSPSKPRDRSHFEQFRSYHERLYAQVEPTSVTPFAPPVLDRALHAVMVAYVRQLAEANAGPWPVPDDLLERAHELLKARVSEVDADELERFEATFERRIEQWERWEYRDWMARSDSEDYALLRYAGDYASREEAQISWAIPTSLRNVDAECLATVSKAYIRDGEGAAS